MTIQEHLEKKLYNCGLFPDQAHAVIEDLKKAEGSGSMEHRWCEDIENYPSQLLAVLWLTAKDQAAKWLKVNKPEHWALPFFDGTIPEN